MSKTFCSYPWEHLYIHTTGHQRLCCDSSENITKDDGYRHHNLANRDGMFDCWNNKYMKSVRKKMLNGEQVPACRKCYDKESQGLPSKRDTKGFDLYKSITVDGEIDRKPGHIELHFGNVCNLSCKMCSQVYSHKIGQELLKIGEEDKSFLQWLKTEGGVVNNWTAELGVVYDWFKNPTTKKDIFEFVSKNVNGLTIIGGEPTAIKEFYELLEFCHDAGTLSSKSMTLTTNLTNTNPKMVNWLKSMESFIIYGSIDGIGDVNDYIRYPSKWETLEKSLDFYCELVKQHNDSKIVVGPTFQSLNIHGLVDFISYFENYGDKIGLELDIWWSCTVEAPKICDYRVLPDSYKMKVAVDLENQLYRLKNEMHKNQVRSHINVLRTPNDHTVPFKREIMKSFVKYNDIQDKHRNTKTWRNLLPDLESEIEKFIGS